MYVVLKFKSLASLRKALRESGQGDLRESTAQRAVRVARLVKSLGIQVPDTQALHAPGGVYSPARQALHRQIVQHFTAGASANTAGRLQSEHERTGQKHAVFMMGGAGSGKSFYATRKFHKHPFFGAVDADAIKEHLANADGLPGDHNVRPGHYHEESSDLSKTLQDAMHKAGKSYVFDGTGANADSLEKKMRTAKSAGYQVHLHYAYVPKAAAVKRDMARSRSLIRSGKEAQFHETHAAVRSSFERLRHSADKATAFDNTGPDVYAPNPHRERREQIMRTKNGE